MWGLPLFFANVATCRWRHLASAIPWYGAAEGDYPLQEDEEEAQQH